MGTAANNLLIASTEACSGKSATIVGMATHLRDRGLTVAYAKPLGYGAKEARDPDVDTTIARLQLTPDRLCPPLVNLNSESIAERVALPPNSPNSNSYLERLRGLFPLPADITLIEAPANSIEGSLFCLDARQIAIATDAKILLLANYHSDRDLDSILGARFYFANLPLAVILNDVPETCLELARTKIVPYLERSGLPVMGVFPRISLLRSASVRELVRRLDAEVLCCRDRLDLLVETLSIGAMNVNSALEYFRRGRYMAVVTGGDRADIQLAALETSTQCLILTGHLPPQPYIISRAEDLEIPILSVDLDTLSTVEIINGTFGKVRIQEPVKLDCAQQLVGTYFNFDRLLQEFLKS